MPKSKHSRGKHPHVKKKVNAGQPPAGTMAAAPAAGNVASTANAAAPAPARPAAPAVTARKAAAAAVPLSFSSLRGDLKKIGMLTGSIVVILIILWAVLR